MTNNANPLKILLVDDDTSLLRLLSLRLQGEGHKVQTAEDALQALKQLEKHSVDVVLSDLRMPGDDGLALFDQITERSPGLPLILMTAHGTIDDAVAATQRGVMGFVTKPINHDELSKLLDKVAQHKASPGNAELGDAFLTQSVQMQQLLEQAALIAKRDVSVLVTGASGTGKEVLARAIHEHSSRAERPFVAINCAALPENLLESELFGHTKGAFTGAVREHIGLMREADGGTLFLDEIGDMPMTLQVKLLRVLQEQQVRPVGSAKHIPIDVRVISATNRDLASEMQAGNFREDLYYRLNVVNLKLPKLNERPEDIPLIARHLLKKSAERHGVDIQRFSDDAMQLLVTADWPGNVRQLVNVVEQCVALTQTAVVPTHLVKQALAESTNRWPTLSEAKDAFEHKYLIKLLKMTEGNVTRAAELAGRNRTDMHKLMKKHQLNSAEFKAAEAG